MKTGLGISLAFGLATVAANARAAEHIDCVDTGYEAEQAALLSRVENEFSMAEWSGEGVSAEVLTAVSARAGQCADVHNWSPDAIEQSIFYRLGSLLATGLEKQAPISPAQMERLKEVVRTTDKTQLYAVVGPMIDAGMEGREESASNQAQLLFLSRLVLKTGMPATKANSEFVGAWLAGVVIRDRAKDRFAKY